MNTDRICKDCDVPLQPYRGPAFVVCPACGDVFINEPEDEPTPPLTLTTTELEKLRRILAFGIVDRYDHEELRSNLRGTILRGVTGLVSYSATEVLQEFVELGLLVPDDPKDHQDAHDEDFERKIRALLAEPDPMEGE